MSNRKKEYIAFFKPFGVLSQFTPENPGDSTIADYVYNISSDIYPIGRLDKDSEGLLLLTNDNQLKTKLLSPDSKTPKTYLAQVEGEIVEEALIKLCKGVTIKHNKRPYKTLPCKAFKIASPDLPDRVPPIRYRKSISTSWIKVIITEGKNRQVRKMGAAVGFPVLRLVRVQIGNLGLGQMKLGEFMPFSLKAL